MTIRSVLPLLLAMCASAQPQSGIAGRVADASSGQALKGAHIRLTAAGFDDVEAPAYGAMSDADGRFAISPIPSGSYRLHADLQGYFFVPKSYIVLLKPNQAIENFQIDLAPQAILSGRVLDEKGEPVAFAGIMVRITSPKDIALGVALEDCCLPMAHETDEDGEFRIAVPPGRFHLEASGQPDTEIRADGTLAPSADATSRPVAVEGRSGKETGGIEIRLVRKKLYTLRGNVTGAAPGAQVKVHARVYLGGEDATVLASKDGSFLFGGLAEGAYHLFAESFGGAGFLSSARQEVSLDSDVANVSLVLMPPITLIGTLAGAANVAVRLESPSILEEGEGMAAVSVDGTFHFDRVQPDRYLLTVRPMPPDGYFRSVELDGKRVADRSADKRIPPDPTDPSFRVPLDLSKLTGAGELRIAIATGARISGTVEGQSGPVTDGLGNVTLIPEDNQSLDSERNLYALVDSQGRYVFGGVPPGRFHVLANHVPESDGDESAEAKRKRVESSEIIELHEGERVTKNLKVAGSDGKNP